MVFPVPRFHKDQNKVAKKASNDQPSAVKGRLTSAASTRDLTDRDSLAENPDLHLRVVIPLINVYAQVAELLDQLLQIFRLEPCQIKRYALLPHCVIGAIERQRRNQTGQ